jgi:hypothetical protein
LVELGANVYGIHAERSELDPQQLNQPIAFVRTRFADRDDDVDRDRVLFRLFGSRACSQQYAE